MKNLDEKSQGDFLLKNCGQKGFFNYVGPCNSVWTPLLSSASRQVLRMNWGSGISNERTHGGRNAIAWTKCVQQQLFIVCSSTSLDRHPTSSLSIKPVWPRHYLHGWCTAGQFFFAGFKTVSCPFFSFLILMKWSIWLTQQYHKFRTVGEYCKKRFEKSCRVELMR